MPQTVILYTTWPDAEKAEAVGAEAVAERLAACANILAVRTEPALSDPACLDWVVAET